MTIRLTIIALLLTTLTAGALTPQEMVMGAAYRVRGAATVIGNAVDLDGSSEYFTTTQSNINFGATSVTVCAWVNATSNQTAVGKIGWVCGFSPSQAEWRFMVTGGKVVLQVYQSNLTLAQNDVSAASAISSNSWHFLVGVANGSNVGVYVDGVSHGSNTAYNGTINNINAVGKIGQADQNAARYFSGLIDEVAIYKNRAFTSNEVVEAYAGGVGKPLQTMSTGTNGLVRLWHLDESGSQSNAYDSASGTWATGTAISNDWVTGKVPK